MNKLEVLKFPDSRLRYKAKPIDKVTSEWVQLGKDMLEIMYAKKGVGLAAIQVNRQVRLLVADTSSELDEDIGDVENRYDSKGLTQKLVPKIKQPLILFNPEVIEKQGFVIYQEGCLSFPSYYADVKRAEVVHVKALNEKNEEIFIKTDGLLSICLQHEIDHLDGKLFIDHLSPMKSARLREEIKKHGYPDESAIESKSNESR